VLSEGLGHQRTCHPLASLPQPLFGDNGLAARARTRWRTRERSGEDSYEGQPFAMSARFSQKVGAPLLAVPL
jgi:hypothetical protein